jgi:hypothetical protein
MEKEQKLLYLIIGTAIGYIIAVQTKKESGKPAYIQAKK